MPSTDLILKPLLLTDAERLLALINENRAYLRRWLPWLDKTRNMTDMTAFIETCQQKQRANGAFECGIWYKEALIGVVGLHLIEWANRKTSIGYWLAESMQGRGIMTEAARALAGYCFSELKLHRIEIRCAVENAPSRRIPERLGFANEGTLRQVEWLYDHYVDHVLYSRLAIDASF